MPKQYTLHRCGRKIKVEKETKYFTAILPKNKLVTEVNEIQEVQKIKRVFKNVYKIKTAEEDVDGIMNHLRSNFKAKAVVHHAYIPKGDAATRYYITDKIIVAFRSGTRTSTIEKIMKLHGIQLLKQYQHLPNTCLFKVTSSAGKNPIKVAIDLSVYKEIEYAEPNLVNRFVNAHRPSDDLFDQQWHLHSKAGIELVANAHVSAIKAWDITRGSKNVVVSVIDDGFDLEHPDLSGPDKIVFPRDFVDKDTSPIATIETDDYHGTPCAGVAIGNENGEGIVGIAPECAFMPIRFDLAADDHMLFEMFEFAGKHSDVISCSWGPPPVNAPMNMINYKQYTQLAKNGGPRGKGCVIVFAAGNYNAPLKDVKNKNFDWFHHSVGVINTSEAILNGNAAHPSVIAVSASTSQNKKAAYSNWGKEITLCAPSDNWHPIQQDTFVPGRGIWTTDNENVGVGFTNNSRYTGSFGGTSSATPLVAGVAGLVIAANPDLTAKQVKQILIDTTDKIIDKAPDIVLNLKKGTYKKGHSEWFGHGKVNAAKAVEMAIQMKKKVEKPKPKTRIIRSKPKASGVKILAALVNPKGKEAGAETISLINLSNQITDLNKWSIDTGKRTKEIIQDLIIAPGGFLKINLSKVKLSNAGGVIRLLNEEKKVIHEVKYTKADAKLEGWQILF